MDGEKTQAFNSKVYKISADAALAIGLSQGIELGLFKGLVDLAASKSRAVTSQQLADHLAYKERYVREWLNSLACADIIDHELIDGVDRYWVESYRHSSLLNGAKMACLTMAAGASYSLVNKCFPLDGPAGTSVDNHPEFHKVLASAETLWLASDDLKKFLEEDDRLLPLLDAGANVLEVGCGSANRLVLMAETFPRSKFVASDISPSVLQAAKDKSVGHDNVSCLVLDACSIPDSMENAYDLVLMFDVFHDVPYPDKLASGIHKALKPGGMLLMNDIDTYESVTANKQKMSADAAYLHMLGLMYCVPTSVYHPGGMGLGPCAGSELMMRMLKESGMSDVKRIAKNRQGLYVLATK